MDGTRLTQPLTNLLNLIHRESGDQGHYFVISWPVNLWVLNPKIGGFDPPKWMVKIVENPMNKWMIWGYIPLFLETPMCIFGWKQRDFFQKTETALKTQHWTAARTPTGARIV